MSDEIWRLTHCSPNYMVSNLGRVKSLPRVVRAGPNGGTREIKGGIVNSWVCKQTGYLQVAIDKKKHNVHRLVILAFIGDGPIGSQVAHNDGCRTNAALTNLRWATVRENQMDRVAHGTSARGHMNRMAKLTKEQVLAIRSDTRTRTAIAADYGVTPEAISHVVLRKNWKWL